MLVLISCTRWFKHVLKRIVRLSRTTNGVEKAATAKSELRELSSRENMQKWFVLLFCPRVGEVKTKQKNFKFRL